MSSSDDRDDFLEFTPLPAVASPCVGICRMARHGQCEGCGRTRAEIAEWSRAGDARRQAILDRIAGAR